MLKKFECIQIDVDKLEFDSRNPMSKFPVSKERQEELKEQLKIQTPAEAIKVYRTIEDGVEVIKPLEQCELVSVAFTTHVEKLWCQVLDVTPDEALVLMFRLAAKADQWTAFDQALFLTEWLYDKGNTVGSLSSFAELCGCTRSNVTFLHQTALVAAHLKFHISPDKFALLRTKGTHLRYIYGAGPTNWIKLAIDMLNNDWSAKQAEKAANALKTAAQATNGTSVATPNVKPISETTSVVTSINHTPEISGSEDDCEDNDIQYTPVISPVTYLRNLDAELFTLQTNLTKAAYTIELAWNGLSDADRNAVYNIGNNLKATIAEIFAMFDEPYPLSSLVSSNNPIVIEDVNSEINTDSETAAECSVATAN